MKAEAQDMAKLNASMTRHVGFVRHALLLVRQELERRGSIHDLSKFSDEEFPGFAAINRNAREHEYGSEEYRAGLQQEARTVELHYARNSHHPEHHGRTQDMGLFDLIEMVCDWYGASLGYGKTSLRRALEINRKRFVFTDEQWWVIDHLVDFLDPVGERG